MLGLGSYFVHSFIRLQMDGNGRVLLVRCLGKCGLDPWNIHEGR